jgi:CPA1 family monovalent cation:H+ antiporter
LEAKLLYYLAGVPLLGVIAQWLAWRLRLPSILLLLGFGVALGALGLNPDVLLKNVVAGDAAAAAGGDEIGPRLLFPVVSLAVAVVLFEGGLTLRLGELKQAGRDVLRLCTIGALVSWMLTAAAAHYLLQMEWDVAALIGAILVVTGPTVIGPLLRQIQPERRVGSIAKWEGIVVDPIGAVLAVLVFEVIVHGGRSTLGDLAIVVLKTAAVGCGMGFATGVLLAQLVRRFWLPDFLQGVFFLAAALGAFALSNLLQRESGLVTVTVLGVYLANQKQASIKHVIEFKEHLVVLLISCLFIVLGSRLRLSALLELGWAGLCFLAVMIVVVRPASVFLATIGSRLNWRERLFLALLAPRGIVAAAVTSVFALELLHQAHRSPQPHMQAIAGQAQALVPVTFLVIVGTVSVYGLTAGWVARRLKLAQPNPQGVLFAGAEPWMRAVALAVREEGFPVLLVDTNFRNVSAARQAGLPAECVSILSEHVREELDLSGIGRLLALTPNDEVNALAAREFAHLFGRANVYQIAPWDVGTGKRQSVAEHLRGRRLFRDKLTHDELEQRVERGAQIKTTRLAEEFSLDDFERLYGPSVVLLFVVEDRRRLKVCTGGEDKRPLSGQTVIALVDQPAERGADSTETDSEAAGDEPGGEREAGSSKTLETKQEPK